MKKAFTVAELLIVLAVIAIIAGLLIVNAVKINKNKAIFKKAFYTIEQVASELINDESTYPYSRLNPGFSNLIAGDDVGGGRSKFCFAFARRLNTVGEVEFRENSQFNNCSFETEDGISWQINDSFSMDVRHFDCSGFLTGSPEYYRCMLNEEQSVQEERAYKNYAIVRVDVNGENKGSNLPDRELSAYRMPEIPLNQDFDVDMAIQDRDRFFAIVRLNGTVSIWETYNENGVNVPTLEARYLRSNSVD